MEKVRKSIIVSIVIESIAFFCLVVGRCEFLGAIDILGKIGVLLHLPGFLIGKNISGNLSWIVIVSVQLLIWFVIVFVLLSVWNVFKKAYRS